MKDNYTIDHDMYLMNHKNGDVLKVTVDNKDKSLKNLQLYRQDGLGNYYYDKNSQLKHQDNLATKKDIVKASKEIGAHNIPTISTSGITKLRQYIMLNTRLLTLSPNLL